ncbi:MAG TPA: hypothetical protein ENN90_13250 [Mariniphaga anaerophila]|uniref:WYL domain-containing protein n=1 Tax=Mariniphaga anaerophila TaxID=1484053 RepID=A0A831LY11_9BACT|nr:hypothetical protein [Mariniphaga anaerophila]
MDSAIVNSIRNKNLLEFYYDGGSRVVEPHCYGLTTKGNEGLRAFQVSGYSSSGEMGWKLFNLSKARSIKVLNESFNKPRAGYKKGDRGMSRIIEEL